MSNKAGDQGAVCTDANTLGFAGAPFGGGDFQTASAFQITTAGLAVGAGKLPANPTSGYAGADLWLGGGDASGGNANGGSTYIQCGLNQGSGASGGVYIVDNTGAIIGNFANNGTLSIKGANGQVCLTTGFGPSYFGGSSIGDITGAAVIIDAQNTKILGRSTMEFSWTSGSDPRSGTDLSLFRDAADTLAQRRSTNAQTLRVYNTYTDASNYERLGITWSGSVCTIGMEKAGTGAYRTLQFATGGNTAISINGSGNLSLGGTQNTTITNMIIGGNFAWWSNTTNAAHLSNTAFNAGARLIFGPAVSTGWACIKPNAAQLQVRLADDSADAPITCSYVRTVATTVASLPAAATAGAGARAFVTDANATTFASIVAAGGANNVPVYSDGTNWRIG